jgi:hypothetical protein
MVAETSAGGMLVRNPASFEVSNMKMFLIALVSGMLILQISCSSSKQYNSVEPSTKSTREELDLSRLDDIVTGNPILGSWKSSVESDHVGLVFLRNGEGAIFERYHQMPLIWNIKDDLLTIACRHWEENQLIEFRVVIKLNDDYSEASFDGLDVLGIKSKKFVRVESPF